MSRDGRKTGGRDFVKGDPRCGRLPLPPEVKAARRLNKTEFERITNRYVWSTEAELLDAKANPETPAIERVLISILLEAIEKGDHSKAEWIAQRLIGKVKDEVEVSTPKPFIVERLDGSQMVLGAKVEESE